MPQQLSRDLSRFSAHKHVYISSR